MKKSLIALAALAFVGAAAAQSSVTLYGIADIYVGDSDAAGSKVAAGSGGVAGSRWGIKGSEDLGGGLKANFNLEQAVNLGNGAAAGFTRQANVGFSGGFGTLKIGKSWNAMDDVYGASNSGFDSALSANAGGVWLNGYAGEAAAQLHYTTPTVAGFTAAVSTQLNGNVATGNVAGGKTTAFNVTYAAGPVAAAVAYEDNKNTTLAAAQKGTMFNGSYDLGAAKLLGSYYTTKPAGGGAKTNSYQLGADVPVSGPLTLSVGFASSKVSGTGTTSRAFGVTGAYALSKRTTAYAGIRAANQVGKDLWAVGVNHKF